MSADLHIHVIPNEPVTATAYEFHPVYKSWKVSRIITDAEFASFFGNCMDSRWFRGFDDRSVETTFDREANALMTYTPNVWVGQVSWLKAALFDEEGKYVPGPISQISDIIDENLPVIDDDLIEKIGKALFTENTTSYSINNKPNDNEVIKFLQKHKGLRCFTVSW